MNIYNHKEIEEKWQDAWEKDQLYKAPENPKNKQYILDMFPYVSGAGLHVGHPEGYTATDIYSRYLRMNNHDVLHPMGWDAFGLPTENYAIKVGRNPKELAEENIATFKRQIKMFGFSYDWSREINTSDPEYYKWTQWLFLQFYKKGLAYKKEAYVNWCPKDQTVLANEQVIDGCCDRCGTVVVQKLLSQWFFKITDYADRLLDELDELDWPEPIQLMQKNWIGRSEGAEIEFEIDIDPKANFVLLHGYNGSPSANFFPWLKNQLETKGYKVQVPALPDSKDPIVAKQADFVLQNFVFDENTILLGHSLGGVVAMKVLEKLKTPIRRLVLAASFIENRFKDHDRFDEHTHDWKHNFSDIKAKAKEIIILRDRSDPVIFEDQADKMSKEFGGSILDFTPAKGHICGKIEPFLLEVLLPSIKVFTTRPDTLFGATYLVLSPEHALVEQITTAEQKNYVINYVIKTKEKTELQRTSLEKDKTGVFTGSYAVNPATKEKIPVWIADYVLATYGTGAIMAVPAHDERDFEFAKKYKLPIKKVIKPPQVLPNTIQDLSPAPAGILGQLPKGDLESDCWTGDGVLVNSYGYDGMKTEEARFKMAKEFGHSKIQYKLRDWLISRQRYWGAPIPIIYCDKCGMQAVPEEDLPVKLPDDVDFRPTGESPLARSLEFNQVKCPNCALPARPDHDTMDTFVDSSWYFFRFTDPDNDKAFADKKKMKQWLPVDTYVGGAEHAVLHLLYARFFTKALKDLKFIDFNEPFLKLRNQGLILGPDGEKMSKSRGNVINPDEVIEQYGADAFRLYEMFLGPLEDAKPWQTNGIIGVKRFLDKVWRYQQVFEPQKDNSHIHKLAKKITSDIENFKFNTAVAAFMEFLNENKKMSKDNWETFLILLAPFAPHMTEDLWRQLGHKDSIHTQPWPKHDEKLVKEEIVTMVVQVMGRVRASLEMPSGMSQAQVKEKALADANVKKHLEGKEIMKEIFVQDKLINFVVK